MKKLMIAAAIVCAAAFAQAASLDWKFTETVKSANYGIMQDLTTCTAYLFTETAWDTFTKSEKTWDDFNGKWVDSAAITKDVGTTTKFETGLQDYAGSSGNYYVVIASEKDGYMASAMYAATAYDHSASPLPSHDDAAWSIAVNKTPVGSSNPMTAFASVPEPTSGLLLLLGVAGLALRRRRA